VVAIDGSLRTPRQGTFEFLQIPRVVVLDQLGEEDRGIGVSLTEVEEITNSVPPPTAVAAPSDNGRQIPADADAQGFVGYPGARCSYTNPAVAIGPYGGLGCGDLPDRGQAVLLQRLRPAERVQSRSTTRC
jgi:hypothetical protein